MKTTFAVLLCGQTIGALLSDTHWAPHGDAHAKSTSTTDLGSLALSLATTSNLTGLSALLFDVLLQMPNSSANANIAEQLQPVVAVVNDTLEPLVVQAQLQAQRTISGFEALFLRCEEEAALAFNQSIADQVVVSKRRHVHAACRDQESALVDSIASCETMVSAAQAVQAYKCKLYKAANTIPSSSCFPADGEDSEAFHARKLADFETNLAVLLQKKSLCNQSRASLASLREHCNAKQTSLLQTRSSCDTKQHILDSSICNLKRRMDSDCAQSRTCQEQALASYQLANASVKSDEASLKKQWEQLQVIRCMIAAVENRQASSAAYTCSNATYNVGHLSVSYVGIPPFSPCQEMAEVMGSPEYMQKLYGDLPGNVHAQSCHSQCCIDASANGSNTSLTG
eukprot:TRINITY_DN49525_c0_g1_i1.p1 TRINITY_DN49525_c0_g1~~TRINITY_DN49525_c0_g1_i1.p1  ORF type:complete len:398 (+),score=68.02 TRINITY_DN49525_c0_g1_i1:81-1274(+)